MAVFIEITTDAFEENLNRQARASGALKKRSGGGAGKQSVRRPNRGLEIKEDTYAIIRLIRADGREIPLIDSSSPWGKTTSGYANFMLQSVAEARMEKQQIVDTFGESYIFFFGEAPRFLDVTATIINSHDFNWEAEWWENYDRFWRGTKSVELGARTYLFYDDTIVEGYMLQAQAAKTSDQQHLIQLQFKLYVTNYRNISFVGDPKFPVRASVDLPPDVQLTDGNAAEQLIESRRGSARAAILGDGAAPASEAELLNLLVANGGAVDTTLEWLDRVLPPSFGIPASTWADIERLGVGKGDFALRDKLLNLVYRTGRPLRSLIADNLDEYTGVTDATVRSMAVSLPEGDLPRAALANIARTPQEADDMFRTAIQYVACFGADVNNPDAVIRLGLGPKFGKSADDGATFKPIPGVPFGFGVTDSQGLPSKEDLTRFGNDPLGSIFGKPKVTFSAYFGDPSGPQKSTIPSRYSRGASDPNFGYPSDFASGPGFGQAGFGIYGGLSFGSGNSTGDPGLKNPNRFTFSGVADQPHGLNRFRKPVDDPTALEFGVGASARMGLGAGTSGSSGGAAINIEGTPSAFAVIAVEGTLNPFGTARQTPQQISAARLAQQRGFDLEKAFGVTCPKPGFNLSEGTSYQDGFDYSLP